MILCIQVFLLFLLFIQSRIKHTILEFLALSNRLGILFTSQRSKSLYFYSIHHLKKKNKKTTYFFHTCYFVCFLIKKRINLLAAKFKFSEYTKLNFLS